MENGYPADIVNDHWHEELSGNTDSAEIPRYTQTELDVAVEAARREEREIIKQIDDSVGKWLSAALQDNICSEFRADIIRYFDIIEAIRERSKL